MSKKNLLFFLKSLGVVFLLSFVLDKIVFYTLSSMEKKVFTGLGVGKLNHFLAVKDSANLLIFGNSRAAHSVNNNLIDNSSFNIGVDGTNILYSTILVKTLKSPRQQLLLFQIDPEFLFDSGYKGIDAEKLQVKSQNDTIRWNLKENGLYNSLQNVYWSLGFNNLVFPILSNYFRPGYEFRNYTGYDPLIVTADQTEMFKKSIGNTGNSGFANCDANKQNELVLKCLRSLKDFCVKHNKKIVFFTAPIYADPCKTDNQAMEKLLGELELPYIDYSDHFKSDSSLANWKDLTHLSDVGARLLTERVRQDLAKESEFVLSNKQLN